MKNELAENIRKMRKERNLTQEQLAEVFGVTVGAVYKWESGLSVPELGMIVEIADFFDTSVDVLIGYKIKDNGQDAILARMNEYCRTRDREALAEAEKALKKYPNSYKVISSCAMVYYTFGTGSPDKKESRRALELLEQSRLLISQSSNPQAEELWLCARMADAYMQLEEYEKGIEILKKNNIDGLFCDTIGTVLVNQLKRPDEAMTFLNEAMLRNILHLISTVYGLGFAFCAKKDYRAAHDILVWGMDLLSGLKAGDDADYTDKMLATGYAMLAGIQIRTGSPDEAAVNLKTAYGIASSFDTSPNYSVGSIRFVEFDQNPTIIDDVGATAVDSLSEVIRLMDNNELCEMWKELSKGERKE